LTPLQRFQAVLPLLAAQDPAGYDTRPAAVMRSGGRILRMFTAILGGVGNELPLAEQLQRGLAPSDMRAARLLDSALILCADHELNVSAFTARCVASAGSSPYEVVNAGLSALAGVRHGGQTERVAALLREIERPEQARTMLSERLRRGDPIPGFGHRLYPEGDPRGRVVLDCLATYAPDAPAVVCGQALVAAAYDLIGERPTIDFGLALLAQLFQAPPGTALGLFALGRTVGWLAHGIEEYALGRLIRPRAAYTGPNPA
jgi:citrate synthase